MIAITVNFDFINHILLLYLLISKIEIGIVEIKRPFTVFPGLPFPPDAGADHGERGARLSMIRLSQCGGLRAHTLPASSSRW